MSKQKQKPDNPEIACTYEGTAFWITDSQLDTILESLELSRNSQANMLEGSINAEPDEEKAEDMYVLCDTYARFHRVLVDLRERRGQS
jgi:hypothetical protein